MGAISIMRRVSCQCSGGYRPSFTVLVGIRELARQCVRWQAFLFQSCDWLSELMFVPTSTAVRLNRVLHLHLPPTTENITITLRQLRPCCRTQCVDSSVHLVQQTLSSPYLGEIEVGTPAVVIFHERVASRRAHSVTQTTYSNSLIEPR